MPAVVVPDYVDRVRAMYIPALFSLSLFLKKKKKWYVCVDIISMLFVPIPEKNHA